MARDWLAARRTEVAADRILDAAGDLFASRGVATVGMNEIAEEAGCSRATLYRYFENRETLRTAYVNRETHRVNQAMIELISGIEDPRERLIAGVMESLRLVRQSPALAAWFETSEAPIGGTFAEQSDIVQALSAAFLISLVPDDPAVVARRARWLVRVLTSLLIFPGDDDADERAMIEEFVVPIIAPAQAVPLE